MEKTPPTSQASVSAAYAGATSLRPTADEQAIGERQLGRRVGRVKEEEAYVKVERPLEQPRSRADGTVVSLGSATQASSSQASPMPKELDQRQSRGSPGPPRPSTPTPSSAPSSSTLSILPSPSSVASMSALETLSAIALRDARDPLEQLAICSEYHRLARADHLSARSRVPKRPKREGDAVEPLSPAAAVQSCAPDRTLSVRSTAPIRPPVRPPPPAPFASLTMTYPPGYMTASTPPRSKPSSGSLPPPPSSPSHIHSFRNFFTPQPRPRPPAAVPLSPISPPSSCSRGTSLSPTSASTLTDTTAVFSDCGSPSPGPRQGGRGRPTRRTLTYTTLPIAKAKRQRPTARQTAVLNAVFDRTFFPSTEMRNTLAKELGMCPRSIQVWFQNKRQGWRTKHGELKCPVTKGASIDLGEILATAVDANGEEIEATPKGGREVRRREEEEEVKDEEEGKRSDSLSPMRG